jgi:hypothetical protein
MMVDFCTHLNEGIYGQKKKGKGHLCIVLHRHHCTVCAECESSPLFPFRSKYNRDGDEGSPNHHPARLTDPDCVQQKSVMVFASNLHYLLIRGATRTEKSSEISFAATEFLI